MQRSEAESLASRFYAARVKGDIEATMAFVTDDFHFHLTGSSDHSNVAMQTHGAADFRTALTALVENFNFSDLQVLKMLVDGDNVAHYWRVTAHNPKNGKSRITELMDFWTVRDGKIAAMVESCDTAMAQWMLTP